MSLQIICLENAGDFCVAVLDQVFCHLLANGVVIHFNIGEMEIGQAAVDKQTWNLCCFNLLIPSICNGREYAFRWIDDQTAYILRKHIADRVDFQIYSIFCDR